MRDIEVVRRELPVDFLEFLPDTVARIEDHRTLHRGVRIDPDLTKSDAVQVPTGHPLMSAKESRDTYRAGLGRLSMIRSTSRR